MNVSAFCFWCGHADRDKHGVCNICYPSDHPRFSSQKEFLAHVLFVRKVDQQGLNDIPEGIIPYDIRHKIDSIRKHKSISNSGKVCNSNDTSIDTSSNVGISNARSDELGIIATGNYNSNKRDVRLPSGKTIDKIKKLLRK